MELFLNLLWVLIAVGAVGIWRVRWLREKPQSRRESLREWTAMGCALVLLFFAVSLTDDLHAEAMLLDECSVSRRHSICSHHSEHSRQLVKETGPAILPRVADIESPRAGPQITSIGFYSFTLFVRDFSEGRAPPSAILRTFICS